MLPYVHYITHYKHVIIHCQNTGVQIVRKKYQFIPFSGLYSVEIFTNSIYSLYIKVYNMQCWFKKIYISQVLPVLTPGMLPLSPCSVKTEGREKMDPNEKVCYCQVSIYQTAAHCCGSYKNGTDSTQCKSCFVLRLENV